MTIQQIYDLAITMGIKADPRGGQAVKKLLEKRKAEFKELSPKKKKFFDEEGLKNPFSDTRILNGSPATQVKRLMAGIDADASEVLIADRLNERGNKIDLVISHHPSGHALASLHDVMHVQVDMFAEAGVPINVAHALFEEHMGYVKRRFSPLNHGQAVDAARLLNIPLMSIHTVWDNLGHTFLVDYVNARKFDTVGELLEAINDIPEFAESTRGKSGPFIVSGSEKSPVGKIVVGFTGGTSGPKDAYKEMAKAGVGTIIEMHMPEDAVTELRKLHVNVIDCGHMAADSIGANIFFDQVEKSGVEIIPCSGFIRVKRGGNKAKG